MWLLLTASHQVKHTAKQVSFALCSKTIIQPCSDKVDQHTCPRPEPGAAQKKDFGISSVGVPVSWRPCQVCRRLHGSVTKCHRHRLFMTAPTDPYACEGLRRLHSCESEYSNIEQNMGRQQHGSVTVSTCPYT